MTRQVIGTDHSGECEHQPNQTYEQPAQRLNRALYILILMSFFLPFATIRSCAGDEGPTYSGFELVGEELGALLVGVLILTVLLLVFSFRKRVLTTIRRGLVQAFKALLCALAILATSVATEMPFMFQQVSERLGFYICIGSWSALYLLSTNTSIRQVVLSKRRCRGSPPPWGLALTILIAAIDLLSIWWSEPNGFGEVALGILTSLLVGAPLILVAMLLAVRYRLTRSTDTPIEES